MPYFYLKFNLREMMLAIAIANSYPKDPGNTGEALNKVWKQMEVLLGKAEENAQRETTTPIEI